MAADWQTVSKRLYAPEERGEGGQICLCGIYTVCVRAFNCIFSLTHLFMRHVCPTTVGWESDNSDAVREAVSAEVKSYGLPVVMTVFLLVKPLLWRMNKT